MAGTGAGHGGLGGDRHDELGGDGNDLNRDRRIMSERELTPMLKPAC
jgi:hypothetical protein